MIVPLFSRRNHLLAIYGYFCLPLLPSSKAACIFNLTTINTAGLLRGKVNVAQAVLGLPVAAIVSTLAPEMLDAAVSLRHLILISCPMFVTSAL